MLEWREIKREGWNKRLTLVAGEPLYLPMPDVSEYSKLREEGRLYLTPYKFYLSELSRSPHDDDPYRFLLIVNSSLHYYVRSVEDGKLTAEKIYEFLQKYYKGI